MLTKYKILIFLIVLSFLTINFLQGSGICIEDGKILSDQELMEVALQKPFQRAYKLPDDDSIKSYLKNHPNCCRVNQDKGLFNLYGLLSGQRWVTSYFEVIPNKSTYFYEAKIDSCGIELKDQVFAGLE